MTEYRRSVAVSLKGGSLHKARVGLESRFVLFDNDTAKRASRTLCGVRLAVDGQGVRWAVCPSWQTPETVLINDQGVERVFAGYGGYGFAAIAPLENGCNVLLQDSHRNDDDTAVFRVFRHDGRQLDEFLNPYSSMGIIQWDGARGVVISRSTDTYRQAQNGSQYRLTEFTESRGWAIGQIDPLGDNIGSIAVINPAGVMKMVKPSGGWNGYTNLASELAVSPDGKTCWIAIPGKDTPEPDDLEFIDVPLKQAEPPSGPPPVDSPPQLDPCIVVRRELEDERKAVAHTLSLLKDVTAQRDTLDRGISECQQGRLNDAAELTRLRAIEARFNRIPKQLRRYL